MNATPPRKPLRLWPGLALAILLVARYVVPVVLPQLAIPALLGGVGVALAVVVWWAFFSRAAWMERLGVPLLMVAALLATHPLLDKSIATSGQGKMFFILALPIVALAFVLSVLASRRLTDGPRRASMAAAIVVACLSWTLIRTGGFTGDIDNDFAWRWSETPEDRLLAQASDDQPPPPPALPSAVPSAAPSTVPSPLASAPPTAAAPAIEATAVPQTAPVEQRPAEWPGFRGPLRSGTVRGARISTDWSASPPVEMWRRKIGPGWSSFAVQGDLFYTQEQRGDHEVVACYRVGTGAAVWKHKDPARYWEAHGGAGPRGTPALSGGRVYTFGATGILNALDSRTGARIWTRNAAADTKTKDPGWGFASSPLVVDDVVIVASAGTLSAYDVITGQPRWVGPVRKSGYSSPHLVTLDGIAQVLLLNGTGVTSVSPKDGQILWEHALPGGARIVQPAVLEDGDILANDGEFGAQNHLRRITMTRGSAGWTSQERWASTALKPNFSDYVVHKGHAYGFDGSILACVDLADGTRKWKGGRYGHGQLVLLADQDLLLVSSEEGEIALVQAKPDQHTELARKKAIEGKTWNHPVVVGDVLLVRNAEEMAAFRLAPATPGAIASQSLTSSRGSWK
jgi:outer membrane protein assembly factor BamB